MTTSDTQIVRSCDLTIISRDNLADMGVDDLPDKCIGLSKATPDNTQTLDGEDLFVFVDINMKGTFSVIHLLRTETGYEGSRFNVPISTDQIELAIKRQTPGVGGGSLLPNTPRTSYVVYTPRYE